MSGEKWRVLVPIFRRFCLIDCKGGGMMKTPTVLSFETKSCPSKPESTTTAMSGQGMRFWLKIVYFGEKVLPDGLRLFKFRWRQRAPVS